MPRDTPLKKTLFACDELSGFVHACGLVRPTGLDGLEPKSVRKKLKQPSFAAGVHRDEVYAGAELLGLELDEHIANVVAALQPIAPELGLRTAARGELLGLRLDRLRRGSTRGGQAARPGERRRALGLGEARQARRSSTAGRAAGCGVAARARRARPGRGPRGASRRRCAARSATSERRRQRAAHEAAADEDVRRAGPARRVALVGRVVSPADVRLVERDVEVARDDHRLLDLGLAVDEARARRSSASASRRSPELVACRFAISSRCRRAARPWRCGRRAARAPTSAPASRRARAAGLLLAERVRVERDLLLLRGRRRRSGPGSRCPCPCEPTSCPTARRHARSGRASAARVRAATACHARPTRRRCRAPSAGTSCRQTIAGRSAVDELDHLAQVTPFRPGGDVLPWKRFQVRTSIGALLYETVRVVDRGSAGVHAWYDHELAAALARRGRRRSRSRRRVSASRSCRRRTATGASSASIRSRRGSSGARARGCR